MKDPDQLKRCLSSFDLIFFGVGAIIGAGIFVITGIAAATKAGPAIIISYLIAGAACAFSALCYAELASSIQGTGSAYNYAREGFGTTLAWFIGWDLILEYSISTCAVAVGWSAYANQLLIELGIRLPPSLLKSPSEQGIFNLPAFLIVLFITLLLSIGVKESARFNNLIVSIKLGVIILFIIIASRYFNLSHWHPFMPFGWSGVMQGAALIFFAYIGFDAVSTAAEESINPQRDLPIGILGSLIISTALYIIVAGLLTGMTAYSNLNTVSPVTDVLIKLGYSSAVSIIALGALGGLTTVILVMYYGLTRVTLAMARDKLLPPFFTKIHPKTRTPLRIIIFYGIIIALLAGLVPIETLVAMVNIGTLTAFAIVCGGIIVLRITRPKLPRPFKVPFNPIIPLLGIMSCLYLIFSLNAVTWWRFSLWMLLGLIVYGLYGQRKAKPSLGSQ